MQKYQTYLMSNSQGDTKIGKSVDPRRREANLKVGDPSIELLAICDDDIEAMLHHEYREYAKNGEWFLLNNKHLLDIIGKYNFKIPEDIKQRTPSIKIEKSEKVVNINEINPFIETLTIVPGRRAIDYNEFYKNKEKYDKEESMPYIYLESADRIYVYVSPLIRQTINRLSGSAAKLLLWIQQSLNYGEDYIKFNTKRFLKETSMSKNTLIKAKIELISSQIIMVKGTDRKTFWINPAILFKGNRAKKYPTNVFFYKESNPNFNSDSKVGD